MALGCHVETHPHPSTLFRIPSSRSKFEDGQCRGRDGKVVSVFGIVCYGTRQRVFEYTHTRFNGTPIVYDPFSTIRQSKSLASEWHETAKTVILEAS